MPLGLQHLVSTLYKAIMGYAPYMLGTERWTAHALLLLCVSHDRPLCEQFP